MPRIVRHTAADHAAVEALGEFLTRCVTEYVADPNGQGTWRMPVDGGEPVVWQVDDPDGTGPLVLVRESDGLRVDVDAHVTVGFDNSGRTGMTPDGGWPT